MSFKRDFWQVIKVKPGCEFHAQAVLQSMNLKTYLPFVNEIRQWSDRRKKIKKCLIPRHVFVKIDSKREREVYSSKYVMSYLNVNGSRAKVWNHEIDRLRDYCQGLHNRVDLAQGTLLKSPVLGVNSTVLKVDNTYCYALSECGRYTIKFKLAS